MSKDMEFIDHIAFLKEREKLYRDHGDYDKAQQLMWRIRELLNPGKCGKCDKG